jgi:hypothetical protein
VTRFKWKLVSVRLEIVLVSVQDRCTVCANCTIDLEIVLDAPDVPPKRRGSNGKLVSVHLETVQILIQDGCTVSAERTVCSEIIMGAPD